MSTAIHPSTSTRRRLFGLGDRVRVIAGTYPRSCPRGTEGTIARVLPGRGPGDRPLYELQGLPEVYLWPQELARVVQ